MYCILMDKQTQTFYMEPGRLEFYIYSDIEMYKKKISNARLVETDYEDLKELTTILYNAGFKKGYLDDEEVFFTKESAYYFDLNQNEVIFAQFLLTQNSDYLKLIQKDRLVTICKIEQDKVFFPTVSLSNGETAVLTYTDPTRIPQQLFNKYPGWSLVKMTFNARCFVNNKFIHE